MLRVQSCVHWSSRLSQVIDDVDADAESAIMRALVVTSVSSD